MKLRLLGVLMLALGLILICGKCVKAEDLHFDIIRFADTNELGQKQKWIIGYVRVDTVSSADTSFAPAGWEYKGIISNISEEITETHRKFVDLVITKWPVTSCYETSNDLISIPRYKDAGGRTIYTNKPIEYYTKCDTTFGEALITWTEEVK